MANTPKVYVLCDNNCRYESLTKEQIYTAIVEALENGTISDVDTGFVQTIKTINNVPLKFFVGTQSDYDVLSDDEKQNLFAIITSDTSKENLIAYLEELKSGIDGLEKKHNDLAETMLKAVTYTPTEEEPLYCRGTFTVDLPRGKTLENLICVMINYNGATLLGMPHKYNDDIKCYVIGVTYYGRGSRREYDVCIKFTETDGTISGWIETMYIGTTSLSEDTKFLQANRAYTGNDYIRLYFQ